MSYVALNRRARTLTAHAAGLAGVALVRETAGGSMEPTVASTEFPVDARWEEVSPTVFSAV